MNKLFLHLCVINHIDELSVNGSMKQRKVAIIDMSFPSQLKSLYIFRRISK